MGQTELAHALKERGIELHRQTIHKIEESARPLRFDEAVLIADILDVNLSEMMQESPELRPLRDLHGCQHLLSMAEKALQEALGDAEEQLQQMAHHLHELDRTDWRAALSGAALAQADRRVQLARMEVESGLEGAVMRAHQNMGDRSADDDVPRFSYR